MASANFIIPNCFRWSTIYNGEVERPKNMASTGSNLMDDLASYAESSHIIPKPAITQVQAAPMAKEGGRIVVTPTLSLSEIRAMRNSGARVLAPAAIPGMAITQGQMNAFRMPVKAATRRRRT